MMLDPTVGHHVIDSKFCRHRPCLRNLLVGSKKFCRTLAVAVAAVTELDVVVAVVVAVVCGFRSNRDNGGYPKD